jgi:hypothetical protein
VLAHQPELWKDIGEGLKPKLTRGVRIVPQAMELNDQGELYSQRKWCYVCSVHGSTVFCEVRCVWGAACCVTIFRDELST